MKKLTQWFMLSCRKATALIDKKIEVKLSLREAMQLRLHKSMCDACTVYEKQSKKIDELLHKHIHQEDPEKIDIIKNEQLKEKIFKNLDEN